MAKLTHKKMFEELLQSIADGKNPEMKSLILKHGYSISTANKPKSITDSKSWHELLNTIDNNKIKDKLNELAFDNPDKRTTLTALQELLKLKDFYPVSRSKVELGRAERSIYMEDNEQLTP